MRSEVLKHPCPSCHVKPGEVCRNLLHGGILEPPLAHGNRWLLVGKWHTHTSTETFSSGTTITTYHLTDEARERLTVRTPEKKEEPKPLPVARTVRPGALGRFAAWWLA